MNNGKFAQYAPVDLRISASDDGKHNFLLTGFGGKPEIYIQDKILVLKIDPNILSASITFETVKANEAHIVKDSFYSWDLSRFLSKPSETKVCITWKNKKGEFIERRLTFDLLKLYRGYEGLAQYAPKVEESAEEQATETITIPAPALSDLKANNYSFVLKALLLASCAIGLIFVARKLDLGSIKFSDILSKTTTLGRS